MEGFVKHLIFIKDKQMRRKSYLNPWKQLLGLIAFSAGTQFVE